MQEAANQRLDKARAFWDGSADWDIHRAILDSEGVRDEATRDEAFDAAGRSDAHFLASFVNPSMTVVDIGCGIGRVMRPLAPHVREIIGVDISEKMLKEGAAYLEGVPNARLVQTYGANLPGIEDGSVDFVYSMLCLIHVDKRNAYRYMREMSRVLKPGGMVLIQVENISSDKGLAEFQRVVGMDEEYPLEFYTPGEIRRLLGSVGLDVTSTSGADQILNVSAIKGSAADWIQETVGGIEILDGRATGFFEGGESSIRDSGSLRFALRSSLSRPCTFAGVLSLEACDERAKGKELYFTADAVYVVQPGARHEIEVAYDGPGQVCFKLDGQVVPVQRVLGDSTIQPGRARFGLSLIPGGFDHSILQHFPSLAVTQDVRITD